MRTVLTLAARSAEPAGVPDGELLARFAASRDEAAFAAVVRRHGPLVLGVCRRVAGHREDAEDAFQAVFLILARKAESLARPELLGNWLYGVAYRVAWKARRAAGRRRRREQAVMPEPAIVASEPSDWALLLDAAVNDLPEPFRATLLLCDLQGVSRAEAAVALGVPEGTISSRLAAGRKKLAALLTKRGLVAPAIGLGVGELSATVPSALFERTVTAAVQWAAGIPLTGPAAALARQGLSTMRLSLVLMATAITAIGFGTAVALPGDTPLPQAPPPKVKTPPIPEPPEPPAPEAAAVKSTKPKMIAMTEFNSYFHQPVWSRDGRFVVANESLKVVVLDGKSLANSAFLEGWLVGLAPDSATLWSYRGGGTRINSEHRLFTWDRSRNSPKSGKRLSGPAGDWVQTAVELDPEDGMPKAVFPDGKTAIFVANERTEIVLRLIETATGDRRREIVRVPSDQYKGFSLSPDGTSMILSLQEANRVIVRAISPLNSKVLWSRESPIAWGDKTGQPDRPVVFSPDGKRVAITYLARLTGSALPEPIAEIDPARPRQPGDNPLGGPGGLGGSRGAGGGAGVGALGGSARQYESFSEIHVYDAATGADAVRLVRQVYGNNQAYDFSHDSRWLVGACREEPKLDMSRPNSKSGFGPGGPPNTENQTLRIWDVSTGKVIKTWNGQADARFAPDRPAILIIEEIRTPTMVDGARRTTYTSSLGLWDLSGLAK